MSLLDKASLIVTPNAYKASKLYSVVPSSGEGDMTVVRATTATRVNSLGLIESVANNVPRIDYTNGSCPSLLVEPQRTNLLTYSADFTNGWFGDSGITATANYGVAPDGTTTSTRLQFASGSLIWRKVVAGAIGTGIFSLYIKGTVGQTILITYSGATDKTITLGNGWNRYDTGGVGVTTQIFLNTYGGATARDIEVWGGQVELGTYPTSYIPTLASTVTRNADVISKTGISSLIGQTEGTIFIEATNKVLGNTDRTMFFVTDASADDFILVRYSSDGSNIILFAILIDGAFVLLTSKTVTGSITKIALKYNAGVYKVFINGSLQHTESGSGFTSNLANVYLGSSGSSEQLAEGINSFQIYKTALTDTECNQLTTI